MVRSLAEAILLAVHVVQLLVPQTATLMLLGLARGSRRDVNLAMALPPAVLEVDIHLVGVNVHSWARDIA